MRAHRTTVERYCVLKGSRLVELKVDFVWGGRGEGRGEGGGREGQKLISTLIHVHVAFIPQAHA